jgi:hypothetical protein
MNRWRVEEDIGSKETDGCPLTAAAKSTTQMGTSEGTLVEREVDDSDFVRSSR